MGKDNFISQWNNKVIHPTHYVAGTKLTIKSANNKSNLIKVASEELKKVRCSAYSYIVR